MTRTTLWTPALAVCAAVLFAIPSPRATPSDPAAQHLRLTKSEPGKDSVVAAPTMLKLWYSQEPQLRLSAVSMTGPNGDVALGPVTANAKDATLLEVKVEGETPTGAYVIRWRTASADGHPIRGEIPFRVQ